MLLGKYKMIYLQMTWATILTNGLGF